LFSCQENEFRTIPIVQIARQGSNVVFYCLSNTLAVKWKHNGLELNYAKILATESQHDKFHILSIKEVHQSFQGNYTCEGQNNASDCYLFFRSSSELHVTGKNS